MYLNTKPRVVFPDGFKLDKSKEAERLSQKERSPSPPHPQHALIRMNSTYLELHDSYFSTQGLGAFGVLLFNGMGVFGVLFSIFFTAFVWITKGVDIDYLLGVAAFSLYALFFLFLFRGFFKEEFFRYTHLPMRFNRKTHKVYVFNSDGTAWAEDWDRLFFLPFVEPNGLGGSDGWKIGAIWLAEDNESMLGELDLPYEEVIQHPLLYSQFEFIRRYMEEPEELPALAELVTSVQDIADRRETWLAGLKRFSLSWAIGTRIIGFPVMLWASLGRWVAMRTCTIPVWPAEVEAECQIDPDDPYIRDRKHLAKPYGKKADYSG